MEAFVLLRLDGGGLEDVSLRVVPPFNLDWTAGNQDEAKLLDEITQEADALSREPAFAGPLVSEVKLDEAFDPSGLEAIAIWSMARVLTALWWVGKERHIKVTIVESKGVDFAFREPDISVDEYIE